MEAAACTDKTDTPKSLPSGYGDYHNILLGPNQNAGACECLYEVWLCLNIYFSYTQIHRQYESTGRCSLRYVCRKAFIDTPVLCIGRVYVVYIKRDLSDLLIILNLKYMFVALYDLKCVCVSLFFLSFTGVPNWRNGVMFLVHARS